MPHSAVHTAVNIKPYTPTSPWLFFSTESTYRLHLPLPQGKVEDHSTWCTAFCFGDQAKTLFRVLLIALGQFLTAPLHSDPSWQYPHDNETVRTACNPLSLTDLSVTEIPWNLGTREKLETRELICIIPSTVCTCSAFLHLLLNLVNENSDRLLLLLLSLCSAGKFV